MSLAYVDNATGLLTLIKQPITNRRFTMDFSALLLNAGLASVVSVSSRRLNRVAGAASVVLGAATISGSSVTFQIGGGTSGEAYKITVVVVDTVGNTLEGDGLLLVKEY